MNIVKKSRSGHPYPNAIFSFLEINDLVLGDTPCLLVPVGSQSYPIQDGHVSVEQMLSVPGIKESMWRYIRTTMEGIPIFISMHTEEECLQWIDISITSDGYCVSPKGFPFTLELKENQT